MIKLVVFDMAGTTVDEDNVVYKTVRKAINSAGYGFTQDEVQAVGAGKEKSQAIRDVLALDGHTHSEDEVHDIFSNFKSLLAAAYQTLEVTEQPDTTATFNQLRAANIRVVLNTGYDRTTAESLIKKIGWQSGRDFDGLVTASDVSNGRPAPDMIHHAMKLAEVQDPSQVAKVGDSQIDIDEGKNASCGLTVGVTTGAQTREQLESVQPSCVIDNLKELLPLLALNTPDA